MKNPTRREFLRVSALAALAAAPVMAQSPAFKGVVDIHQHVNYRGRFDDALLKHQRTMGIARSVLLPAASVVTTPSTHQGKSNGLAALAYGNPACRKIAEKYPDEFVYFVNEVPDLDGARAEMEKYLKLGAIGIGEQKFAVECDSPAIQMVADLAKEYNVPVLLHFQHKTYNLGYERFHKILEKYPTVNFIGHAQTFWGNIDKNHVQEELYPKGPVTPGGLTDRYLTDYPNMFGDLSAGSGLNAFTRDEEHGAAFLLRHHTKLLYGSDCADVEGQGEKCSGAGMLAMVRKLVKDETALHHILGDNARRIMRV